MSKQQILHLIESRMHNDGMIETGISGIQIFRMTEPVRCAPAVYDPCVIAIVSGTKEALLDGQRYKYDSQKYLCCPMSMPVEAGTPKASPDNPLLGVYISLDTRAITELAIEMDIDAGIARQPRVGRRPQALSLARWSDDFTDALLRLLQVSENATDAAVLGRGRLKELHYAILKGEAGLAARRAFGTSNDIARTIDLLSSRLDETISIDEMAAQVGMSRAVFHRRFKEATTMSPIQFVKSMRLNKAAMKIASGLTVTQAAMDVGYVSTSQFSREFKRMYGKSPRQWFDAQQFLAERARL